MYNLFLVWSKHTPRNELMAKISYSPLVILHDVNLKNIMSKKFYYKTLLKNKLTYWGLIPDIL